VVAVKCESESIRRRRGFAERSFNGLGGKILHVGSVTF